MSRRTRSTQTRFSLFVFQDIITCVMGIMLLLTLMLSLQIVVAPALLDSERDTRNLEAVEHEISELAARAKVLTREVEAGRQLLAAGALMDASVLTRKRETLEDDNDTAQAALQALLARLAGAETDSQQLANAEADTSEADRIKRQQEIARLNRRQIEELEQGKRIVYETNDSSPSNVWIIEVSTNTNILAAPLGRAQKPESIPDLTALRQWMNARNDASFLLVVKPALGPYFTQLTEALRADGVPFGFDLLPDGVRAIDPDTGAGTQ